MTPEQQKALALARARRRRSQEQQFPERDSVLGVADTFMRGAADTASFGAADEIAAGLGSGFGLAGDYDQELSRQRSIDESDSQNRFGWRLAGQLAGGFLTGGILAPWGLAARAQQAGLGLRSLAGAGEGAALGGLYGFGSGEGVGDRTVQAAQGAVLGAGIGGILPAISAGAGKAYEGVRNWMRAEPIARQAGASPESLRTLGAVMQADDSLGLAGQSRMARAGQEAMLADAGPTARRMLDTAIQKAGPGARKARTAIDERVTRDSRALVNALDDILGKPQGVTAARTAIREGSKASRSSAYDAAYQAPIDYSHPRAMQVEELVRTRVPSSAIRRANELMRLEGVQSQQILANVADDGSVVFERLPDVRQLDYITRALNDLAEAGEGAGALGGQTALGRAYQNLSREIRDGLKETVPEYAKALETAADPIRRSKAIELGSKLLSPGMTRDQVSEAIRGMTDAEKNAVAQGIRSQLDDAMARVTRTVMDGDVQAREAVKALKDLSSRANREKLALVIGKDKANTLFRELDRVASSFDLRAAVSDNSATYARLAMEERIRAASGQDNPIRATLRGEPVNASKRIVQALTGETPAAASAREDQMYAELARLLTTRGGAGQRVYNAINKLGETDMETAVMRAIISRALAGPQVSYPAIGGVESQLVRQTDWLK